jgi:hypothetical protein
MPIARAERGGRGATWRVSMPTAAPPSPDTSDTNDASSAILRGAARARARPRLHAGAGRRSFALIRLRESTRHGPTRGVGPSCHGAGRVDPSGRPVARAASTRERLGRPAMRRPVAGRASDSKRPSRPSFDHANGQTSFDHAKPYHGHPSCAIVVASGAALHWRNASRQPSKPSFDHANGQTISMVKPVHGQTISVVKQFPRSNDAGGTP